MKHLRSLRRSIRGRVWLSRGYVWRWRPWLGGDEYNRRTLVIPIPPGAVVIALWESLPSPDEFDPYAEPLWARWKQVREYGRLER